MVDSVIPASDHPIPTPGRPLITLTARAAARIAALGRAEERAGLMLRVTISGGGCSGFQYGFSLDDRRNDDDAVFEQDGSLVVVDEVSLELLGGAEIDFVEDLIGAGFQVHNPNATSSCGCGSSFAI
jgi:iron-sulfur cluster insertion protein